jgi:hypothetical protein
MAQKPWILLDPNDFQFMWWRKNEILDINTCKNTKEPKNILAYYIIQDENMGGIFWHISEWYINDPNRYNQIIWENQWPFNIKLTHMKPGNIVYLKEYPEIQFNVYYSNFGLPDQLEFCKILERIISPFNEQNKLFN